MAILVCKADQSCTPEEIMEYCREKLASYKRPRAVKFVEELPRNAMGKVLKRLLRDEYGIESMAHVTCASASRDELRDVLQRLSDAGVENVLALRGDGPNGEPFEVHAAGFAYGSELAEKGWSRTIRRTRGAPGRF